MGISEEDRLVKITEAESRLAPRELAAYKFWSQSGQARLSPTLAAQLYALFLQGKTSDEILRLNKGISLAQLTWARVEGEWDLQREEYQLDLFKNTRAMLQQSSLEAVRFLTDVLAVTHKKYGDAAKKYLQTGDEGELKGFEVNSLGQYKQLVEILQKLTGQENPRVEEKRVSGEVTHNHKHVIEKPNEMSAEDAGESLRAALNKVRS